MEMAIFRAPNMLKDRAELSPHEIAAKTRSLLHFGSKGIAVHGAARWQVLDRSSFCTPVRYVIVEWSIVKALVDLGRDGLSPALCACRLGYRPEPGAFAALGAPANPTRVGGYMTSMLTVATNDPAHLLHQRGLQETREGFAWGRLRWCRVFRRSPSSWRAARFRRARNGG
jgi:hypothetical protein